MRSLSPTHVSPVEKQQKQRRSDYVNLGEIESGMLPSTYIPKKHLPRLRRAGVIRCFRHPDPNSGDRLIWWVELTPAGKTYLASLKQEFDQRPMR